MAGIQNMSPQPGSAHNFTGQCNDAFFRLAKQVMPRIMSASGILMERAWGVYP